MQINFILIMDYQTEQPTKRCKIHSPITDKETMLNIQQIKPRPVPNFNNKPDYGIKYGKNPFNNLDDFNNNQILNLYRYCRINEEELDRTDCIFYGTNLKGIESYNVKPRGFLTHPTLREFILPEEEKQHLVDLTDPDNFEEISNLIEQNTLEQIYNSLKLVERNDEDVYFEESCRLPDLKHEREAYKDYGVFVRFSDSKTDDIQFINILKNIFKNKKGIYTKCLKPIFPMSHGHAEVVIWDKELNRRLYQKYFD